MSAYLHKIFHVFHLCPLSAKIPPIPFELLVGVDVVGASPTCDHSTIKEININLLIIITKIINETQHN
jgi:hypothetical protein